MYLTGDLWLKSLFPDVRNTHAEFQEALPVRSRLIPLLVGIWLYLLWRYEFFILFFDSSFILFYSSYEICLLTFEMLCLSVLELYNHDYW